VENYHQALTTRIDINKNYDCNILFGAEIYKRFISEGLIFSILSRENITSLEKIFTHINVINSQIAPIIRNAIKECLDSNKSTVDVEDNLVAQKLCNEIIHELKQDIAILNSIGKKLET